jgi:hypothetical protein
MPRPKKYAEDMTPLGFRLPNQLIARIDAFCERATGLSGFQPSRSDAIRVLLERGLTIEGFPHSAETEASKAKAVKPKAKRSKT